MDSSDVYFGPVGHMTAKGRPTVFYSVSSAALAHAFSGERHSEQERSTFQLPEALKASIAVLLAQSCADPQEDMDPLKFIQPVLQCCF